MNRIATFLTILFSIIIAEAPASAYFDTNPGSLVMTVYSPTGNEQSFDLGLVNSLSYAPGTVLWNGTLDASAYTADSRIGIWGMDFDDTSFYEVYFSSSNPNPGIPSVDAILSTSWTTNAMNAVKTGSNGTNSALISAAGNSYNERANAGGTTPGWMGGTSTDASGERALAGVYAGTEDEVSLYLYRYRTALDEAGELITTMTRVAEVQFDGNSLVVATPVPGALWLLGSGLIGLVGLRRKQR